MAKEWFCKAAAQGHFEALTNIGVVNSRGGKGMRQSDAKVVKYFRRAADEGQPTAQFKLGETHEEGRGVGKSLQLAKEWYFKAADQGHKDAQMDLASLISMQGIDHLPDAAPWLRRAV